MRTWSTIIIAKCPITGEISTFCGQNIKAPTRRLAHEYCQTHGLGYLHISDELISEIPCKQGTYEPDFDKIVDYDTEENN